MTEKLYYKDAYIKSFTAKVLSCEKISDGYEAVLDKTAFFPEEGGQYADTGRIGDCIVTDVREADGIIYHKLSSPIAVGESVIAELDFDERFEKMQCHTAEHILSGLFHSLYGVENVGFHLGGEDVTMDISRPLAWEELIRVEQLANQAVFDNIKVISTFPDASELPSLEYRSKLDITEGVRLVNIEGYDSCACCAPHVGYTGEIGLIKILDAVKMRGGMRLTITAGKRAYRVIKNAFDNLGVISRALSVPKLETGEAVLRSLAVAEEYKNELKSLRISTVVREAERIEGCEGNLVRVFDGADYDGLIAAANKLSPRVSGFTVLLSGADGSYKYVISSNNCDMRAEIKKINAALCGRGGGSSVMAQGNFTTVLTEIEKYFS